MRVGGKNPKGVWWKDENEIKAAVRRKDAAWKEMLSDSDEEAKEKCMEAYRKFKRCILLLKSNLSRQHSKVLYCWGVRRRGKTGNHRKVGVKREWWALAQPPYSLQGNGRQSPRVNHLKRDKPHDAENPGKQEK